MLLVVAGGWKNWSRDFNASSDFLINLKPSRHFDWSDLRNLLELWNEKSDTIKKKSWKIETKIKFSSKQIMIHLFWRETFFLASTHVNGISSRRKKSWPWRRGLKSGDVQLWIYQKALARKGQFSEEKDSSFLTVLLCFCRNHTTKKSQRDWTGF